MTYDRQLFAVDDLIESVHVNQVSENIEQVRTQHKAATEPPVSIPGTLWLDDSDIPWKWKVYDGTDWRVFAAVSSDEVLSFWMNEQFATDDATPNIDPTEFNPQTAITELNWESIGPTGSGADNIWAGLDPIPLSADWAEIRAEISANISSSAAEARVFVRTFGSSVATSSFGAEVLNARMQCSGCTSVGVIGTVSTFTVPLDSQNRFEITWEGVGTTNFSSRMYAAGYGHNR